MQKIKYYLQKHTIIYTILALFSLFLACISNDYDYDLYARLVVGEHFFNTGWISYHDFLSYTPTHIWFDHEWGSSLIFYGFLKLFGNFGLILIHAIALFFTTFFIIKTQRLQKPSYPISLFFILGFMCLFAHLNPSIVRCHMFSFMLFSMLLYFLEKSRKRNSNLIWWMPIITVIWNNLHGGVVSGLGLIFIYMISEMLTGKKWRKYFLVLLVSTPLLAINPYGLDYINFLLSANTKNRKYITEWWTVFAQRHVLYYYSSFCTAILTFLLVITTYCKKRYFDLTKILVLITTAALGILHVKLLSITVIVIAALYYNEIIRIFDKNIIKYLNKLAYVVMTFAILYIPFTHPTVARTSITKFPVIESEFLRLNNIKGNLLTSFGTGSYVSYKLYPQNLIYMDGRYEEVYYDRELNNLIIFEGGIDDNWDNAIKNYPTEILMLPNGFASIKRIKADKEWTEIYKGNHSTIFVNNRIAKNKDTYKTPPTDIKYYQQREFEHLGEFK